MRRNKWLRRVVDIAMLALLAGVIFISPHGWASTYYEEYGYVYWHYFRHAHIFMGMGLLPLIAIHVWQNWNWINQMAKIGGGKTLQAKLKFYVIILLLFSWIVVAFSSLSVTISYLHGARSLAFIEDYVHPLSGRFAGSLVIVHMLQNIQPIKRLFNISKRGIRIFVDLSMVLLLAGVILYSPHGWTSTYYEGHGYVYWHYFRHAHIFMGLALLPFVALHTWLNWRWFTQMAKVNGGKGFAAKFKFYVIVLLLFTWIIVAFSSLAVTISYLHGARSLAFIEDYVHPLSGRFAGILTIVHLGQNLNQIKKLFTFKRKKVKLQ